jgi:N-methylhydantoinase A/oxoprolinase/acetone carboxylase beta subunit
LLQAYAELDARCDALMRSERVPADAIRRHYLADVCYVGQSYHLEVPVDLEGDTLERLQEAFYRTHDRIYGHSTRGPIKFVNLRAVHQADCGSETSAAYVAQPGEPRKGTRPILTTTSPGFVEAIVYERARMGAGMRFEGPAIVEQADTTTVVEPGWQAEIDASGTLILTRELDAQA